MQIKHSSVDLSLKPISKYYVPMVLNTKAAAGKGPESQNITIRYFSDPWQCLSPPFFEWGLVFLSLF